MTCNATVRHALFATALLSATATHAQTQTRVGVPERGHGSVAILLQHATIHERTRPRIFGGGLEDFGEITARTAELEVDYGITDRLAVTVTLPFKSNRYRGDFPHDPRQLLDDRGQDFLDDGAYHSNFGDWGVSLRWQWRTEPVVITPFVGFYWPSHSYPLFTETQAGTRQRRVDVGINAGDRFGRTNFFWQLGYAYSYLEKTRPADAPARRVNHGIATAELGWLATPELTVRGVLSYKKTYNGLEFPDEFNLPPVGDQFYYHDQLFRWGGTSASVAVNWRLGDRYALTAGFGKSLHVEWGHKYAQVYALGIERAF